MDLSHLKNQLVDEPLKLLSDYKIDLISTIIRNHNINNFLEIGTFVGGAIYTLSKKFPDKKFHTIDINDYQAMSEDYIKCGWGEIFQGATGYNITAELIESLQYFYNISSLNATFYSRKSFTWKDTIYDAILIDGDHHQETLRKDLYDSYENIRHKGFIFVDDMANPWLNKEVKKFCKLFRQHLDFISTELGKDIAVIRVDKKLKRYRFDFQQLLGIHRKNL